MSSNFMFKETGDLNICLMTLKCKTSRAASLSYMEVSWETTRGSFAGFSLISLVSNLRYIFLDRSPRYQIYIFVKHRDVICVMIRSVSKIVE